MEFDFDFFMNAYKEDPDGYEELCKAFVHNWIDKTFPDDEVRRNRLKGLYWKCQNDVDIRNIKDPMVRADRANTKMWMEFRKLNDLLQSITKGSNHDRN